ncbi:sulfotransferase [Hyphomonas johnsonii]|uniref:sulfotransferase n=1 Tax=Hyphomonas johnsonii TaxID=81031 RepID=UPI001F525F9D|nr:sulfotransferase [Hyphomonas johnsonii]
MLIDAGIYLGSDLNDPNDNLWFTLLFKRLSVLDEPQEDLEHLFDLFSRRMTGEVPSDEADIRRIKELASIGRSQHPAEWLLKRADRFLSGTAGTDGPVGAHQWGWKEPNTHVIIDKLLTFNSSLRYIHIMRNGLDMAFNRNQNQPALWGSVFLGSDGEVTPRRSLQYWCVVHRRIQGIADAHPGRVLLVSFDALCRDPQFECRRLLDFCDISMPDTRLEAFANGISTPRSTGVFRQKDTSQLAREDIAYVESLGFETR